MFIKIYQYDVKRNFFQKWKKNNNAARNIYRKYGGGNWQRLIQKNGNLVHVIELDVYRSKQQFKKIAQRVDENPKIHELFKEFINLIKNKRYTEGEFENV